MKYRYKTSEPRDHNFFSHFILYHFQISTAIPIGDCLFFLSMRELHSCYCSLASKVVYSKIVGGGWIRSEIGDQNITYLLHYSRNLLSQWRSTAKSNRGMYIALHQRRWGSSRRPTCVEISQKKRSSAPERRAKEFWQLHGKTKIEHDPAGRGKKTLVFLRWLLSHSKIQLYSALVGVAASFVGKIGVMTKTGLPHAVPRAAYLTFFYRQCF